MPESPRKSCCLRLVRESDVAPAAPPPPKPRLTEAERCRLYRQRRKQDPAKEEEYRQKNKERCKKYRSQLSEDAKKEYNTQGAARKAASREKKKLTSEPRRTTRKDAAAQDAQREKWRQAKRRERQNMHWKTKEKLLADRRAAYAAKKKLKHGDSGSTCITSAEAQDDRTPTAQRKALQRAREGLPKSPRKFAATITKLVKSATPRKRSLLQERLLDLPAQQVGQHFVSAIRNLRGKRFLEASQQRKALLGVLPNSRYCTSSMALLLNMSKKTYKQHTSKKTKTISKKKEAKVNKLATAESFFEDNAFQAPDKKLVSKKSGKPTAFLQKPLRQLHMEYKGAGGMVPFSTFAKCRPRNVRLLAKAQLRQCLCEYCTNVSLKLQSIRAAATAHGLANCCISTERDAVKLVTCSIKEKACCYGTCGNCSTDQLDQHLAPLLQFPDDQLKWYRWESQTRVSRGKQVSRKMLMTKVGNLSTLMKELKEEVDFLKQHLFRADWQHAQFITMKNLDLFPISTILMVTDFAENYTCTYQDEVQAAHWAHDQVTIHPTVTYICLIRCPACLSTTTESLVFISGDTKHDFHAVQLFTLMALEHLRGQRGLNVQHIIQWTDGCAAQYKSKGPFSDLSKALETFDATMQRHFFGSRHGKGPSDGESAVVKQHTTRAVKAGTAAVASDEEMFAFLQASSLNKQPPEEGCAHSLRTFFWVTEGTIDRERPAAQTVKGTCSFHAVKCIESGCIHSRHLSCACGSCLTGIGECLHHNVAGPWDIQHLQPSRRQPQLPRAASQRRPRRALAFPSHPPPSSEPGSPAALDLEMDCIPSSPCSTASSIEFPGLVMADVHPPPQPTSTQLTVMADVHPPPQPTSTQLTVMADAHPPPQPTSTQLTVMADVHPPPQPTTASPAHLQNQKRNPKKGDWVRVGFRISDRHTKEYIGKVLEVDGQEAQLTFLRDRGSYYSFPVKEDKAWVDLDQIVAEVGHPTITGRDQYTFDG